MKASIVLGCTLALLAASAAWISATDESDKPRGQYFSPDDIRPVQRVLTLHAPSSIKLAGELGRRFDANTTNWLLKNNEDSLLLCFTQRPGWYGYQGEHVGKWIDAATKAWANSHNAELRAKLDRVVHTLLSTQLADGYLGTYAQGKHWSRGNGESWDVWVHSYDLVGLLTYAELTGSEEALTSSRRIGDLLIRTFGKRSHLSINSNAPHYGMAAGSILGPIVRLYRATKDIRYLQFAVEVVDGWENDDGPALVTALTAGIPVSHTANGKAYEMLSCLNGLLELFEVTGNRHYLIPVLNAWQDIKAHQLLPTGGGSQGEFWFSEFPECEEDCDGMGEVCVTWNWMQLNAHLLCLTGDVAYADEIERTVYNQLFAAQKFDGSAWSYFTNLQGKRNYTDKQTCCSSNGPRAIASLPSLAYLTTRDGIVVNFFSSSTASFVLPSGDSIEITQTTDYPITGRIDLKVKTQRPVKFSLHVRIPQWSYLLDSERDTARYKTITRIWNGTTSHSFLLSIPTTIERVKPFRRESLVLVRGPEVMVPDTSIAKHDLIPVNQEHGSYKTSKLSSSFFDRDGRPVYLFPIRLAAANAGVFIPFSDAGKNGKRFSSFIHDSKNLESL